MASSQPNIKLPPEVWTLIASFFDDRDVVTLVGASKICTASRDAVIDTESGKIKTSRIEIKDVARVADTERWKSAPRRTPYYVSNLLSTIHFPTVKTMDITFPSTRVSWDDDTMFINDAHTSALPILADNLVHASNLEEVEFQMTDLIKEEALMGAPGIQGLHDVYRLMGENFASAIEGTQSLKKLKLLNQANYDDGRSRCSAGFLDGMVPVLQAGRNSLEYVLVQCGHESIPCIHSPNAGRDFFRSIFELNEVKAMHLQLIYYGPLLGELIDASASVNQFHSDSLEEVCLMVSHQYVDPGQAPSIEPFLSLFSNVSTLKDLTLNVPFECWNETCIEKLGEILNLNPSLNSLVINFLQYYDVEGRILDYLAEFLRSKPSLDGLYIALTGIAYVDVQSDSFQTLRQLAPYGQHCLGPDDYGLWEFMLRPPPNQIVGH